MGSAGSGHNDKSKMGAADREGDSDDDDGNLRDEDVVVVAGVIDICA